MIDPSFLLHPLGYCQGTPHQQMLCKGYNFWSGIGSDVSEITLLGMVVALIKHHNCHSKRCLRPGHKHPVHGWPACKKHWHEVPSHIQA
jgi:hypothetical protein